MKKKLESELVSIAHRILKLKGKENVDKMHEEVAKLYEKLTVLKFAHENFEDDMPTIGNDSSFFGMLDEAFNNTVSDTVEIDDKVYVNVDERDDEAISEPAIEKIKDIVAQMPSETHQVDAMFEGITNTTAVYTKELDELAKDYQEMPIFERVSDMDATNKSLNEQLKSAKINIGLNDRIGFIKHLFGGSDRDFNRVISQLNTVGSFEDAQNFIKSVIKPDYNDWQGKEEYEERFMEIISNKFK